MKYSLCLFIFLFLKMIVRRKQTLLFLSFFFCEYCVCAIANDFYFTCEGNKINGNKIDKNGTKYNLSNTHCKTESVYILLMISFP